MIVEDDYVMRKTLSEVFSKRGFKVFSFDRGMKALEFVKSNKVDLSLLDLRLPDISGLAVLKGMHEIDDNIMVIVVTAYPEVKTAVSALKAGAYDYINKPFELDELRLVVDKALEAKTLRSEVEVLRHQKSEDYSCSKSVGGSALDNLMRLAASIAKTPRTSVLIRGETGTGKEVMAKAIHCMSDRSSAPFIKINCSAIPENLLEAELFGYEKGAFTDAKQSKHGLFELADGGTIFLDEIGDMEPRLQPKLLQVLEQTTFRRVGGTRDISVDVRVVAATNRDLESMVREKKFREDLYYRLKIMELNLPPLRERPEDIIPLAEHFIRLNNVSLGKDIRGLSPDSRDMLLKYSWPGNVRELKNVIERATILAQSEEIVPELLPREVIEEITAPPLSAHENTVNVSIEEMEKNHILRVINSLKGNKSQASKVLGISRQHLRKKLKKYSMQD